MWYHAACASSTASIALDTKDSEQFELLDLIPAVLALPGPSSSILLTWLKGAPGKLLVPLDRSFSLEIHL